MRNTFRKEERLCGELRVSELFKNGNNVMAYPLRACWRCLSKDKDAEECRILEEKGVRVQVLMSVPKKKLRRANKRNRAKRLMRESYRLCKHSLVESLDASSNYLQIAFVWVPDTLENYSLVSSKMQRLLDKIRISLEAENPIASQDSVAQSVNV